MCRPGDAQPQWHCWTSQRYTAREYSCTGHMRMPDEHRLDAATVRRRRDAVLRAALPVRFAGPYTFVVDDTTETWPVVQVEANARPDVADLARVQQSEGLHRARRPPFRYLFVDGQGYMEFVVEITDPVACHFTFVLAWPIHAALFTAMLDQGVVLFTSGPLADAVTHGIGMAINQPELEQVVARWRTLRDPAMPPGGEPS